jgi:DNA repair protein RadC
MLSPREVYRAAIVVSAFAIILMHNHPSGDPDPSHADRRATTRMREAGELLQIKLFDHIIIGDPATFSFRESGLL